MQNVIIKSAVSMSGRLELATPASSLFGNNIAHSLSKHLLSALMLAFMLVCGGTAWGQELTSYGKAEINAAPTSTTEETAMTRQEGIVGAWYKNTTAEFNGFGGNEINGKWFVKLSGDGYIKIRVAKGSVVAGDVLRVEVTDIYQNADKQNLGFKVEGSNGTVDEQELDNAIHILDYTLKAKDIRSENGSYDYIQINRNGNSGCGYHSVEILNPNDGYVVAFSSNNVELGTVSAKIFDTDVTISSGTRLPKGTKVQFTAETTGYNIWWKWNDGVNDDYDSGKTKIVTINSDVTMLGRLSKGIYLYCHANNGSLGSVKMVRVLSGTETTDEFHLTPYPGDVRFVATPNTNVNFDGWYRDEACTDLLTSELEYTQTGLVEQETPIHYWAKFTEISVGDAPIGGQRIRATLANIGTGLLDTNTSTTDPETGVVTPVVIPGIWSGGLLKTQQASYNHVDIFRFGELDKANVDNASNYTGFRFHANKIVEDNGKKTRTPFRLLIYISGEANPRIITITDSNIEDFAYTWEDLGIASNKVSDINRICFAGQQGGPTLVKFSNVWIEKIDDVCHTFVTYEDDMKKYNWESNDYTFRLATPEGEATAVFSDIGGGDRKDITNEIKLKENLTITAPAGKYLKAVKLITNTTADKLVFSPEERVDGNIVNPGFTKAVTDGNEVVWTRGGNTTSIEISKAPESGDVYIAKIEVVYDNTGVKQPALKRKDSGVYTVDLSLVKADTWSTVAYDEEITTAYCSKTTTYCGNFNIEFEEPLDLTELTKLVVNYEGEKVGNVINFIDKDGVEKKAMYSYNDDGIINFESKDVSALTNIKIIRFNNGNGTTGAMKLNYIDLYISHIAPKVTLDSNILTEYEIGQGEQLTISAHATQGENGPDHVLWREYTYSDGVYTVIPAESNIIKDYSSSYTIPSTLALGPHYFGARAYQDCSAHKGGSWVTSEPVIVKVTVLENNINESRQVSTTFDGNTESRDYWLYVPKGVKDKSHTNVPVVFALHGGSEDYQPTHSGQLNFNSLADQYNFVVVYPRAKEHLFPHFNANPARAWLATGGENEDTKYFEAILNAIEHNTDGYTINTDKVYMAGFSVGGMMAYATANVLPGKFAAFASLAGFPMNETHLRHHGDKPVPFLHVHGTKDDFVNYKYMPTIVDNMVARNGLSYTPTSVTQGNADIWGGTGKTTYTKSVYGSGSKTPYVYYEVGTGMTASDTGLGHTYWCALDGVDVKKVMWDFLSQFALTDTRDSNIEFAPQINGMAPGVHNGWRVKENNNLLQYGETGGYSTATQNVYHSLQLKKADHHYLNFTLSGNTTDNVNVRLYKIGSLDPFNTLNASFSSDPKEVLNLNYKAGQSITIDFKTEEDGEYQLIITKENKWADINVTDLSIKKTGSPKGTPSDKPVSTDFDGWYNYNQRLFAQWNFDLCDGFRFNVKKINSTYWNVEYDNTDTGNEKVKNGTVIYTYKPAITPSSKTDYANYQELTYDGTNKIPALAGLKFMTEANSIEVHVDYQNGIINGTHLVVNENVKMIVPYVENSYRNDAGDLLSPQVDKSNLDNYKNCMHHIKRDIVYIALHEGSIWDGKHVITDECIDDTPGSKTALFHNGGDEFVNEHTYQKGDYFGRTGTPCVIQFKGTTVLDRIGVNRNLTFSFYTEYISEYGVPKPTPRMRVIGSPTGLKVAGISETGATYEGAIAMTFGGWKNTDGNSNYEAYNQEQNKAEQAVSNATVTDMWSDLGVCIGDYPDKSKTFMTWGEAADYPVIGSVNTPMAADGFPVTSVSYQLAKSESLMPSSTTGNKYHEACQGNFATSYTENYTPWTLPCRGAYVKFEPTLPGVLNVDVLQKNNKKYYVVDEFGKPVENVFTKTATSGSTNTPDGNGGYTVTDTKDDYVKYCFNVYPGKTYYIFSNEHGMGLTGFYFEPYVYKYAAGSVPAGKTEEYARMDVGVKTLENDAPYVFNDANTTNAHLPEGFACGDTHVNIYSPDGNSGNVEYPIHYSEKAVKVRMNRAFKAGEWTSICFPFSLNQNMMEQIFGKGTKVILLRDIQNRKAETNFHTVANFIMHENQDILAGYPYLICPTDQITSGFTTTVCLYQTAPGTPSISGTGFKTNVGSGDFGGDGDYTFKGSFGVQNVSKGSYLTSGGKLARAGSAGKIKGYRAFLEYSGSEENMLAKAITMFNLGDSVDDEYDQPTFIDGVQVDDYVSIRDTRNDNNVYNVHGQIVRRNTRNLVGLPKGAYIVNGKKHIVK